MSKRAKKPDVECSGWFTWEDPSKYGIHVRFRISIMSIDGGILGIGLTDKYTANIFYTHDLYKMMNSKGAKYLYNVPEEVKKTIKSCMLKSEI